MARRRFEHTDLGWDVIEVLTLCQVHRLDLTENLSTGCVCLYLQSLL